MEHSQLSELVSAYLDGEVTVEERALVEQTLVENSTLRRLYYEFRALRERLVKLPRFQVRTDLRRAVLRLVTQGIVRPTTRPIRPLEMQPAKKSANLKRRKWQAMIWFGSAVAASLLLFVIGPFRNTVREEIALGPEKGVDARKKMEAETRSIKMATADPAEGVVAKSNVGPLDVANDKFQSDKQTREPAASSPVAGAAFSAETNGPNSGAVASPKRIMMSRGAIVPAEHGQSMTVVCDVSGPAYETELRRSLAKHNIVWSENDAPTANLPAELQPLAKKSNDEKPADADQRRNSKDFASESSTKTESDKHEVVQSQRTNGPESKPEPGKIQADQTDLRGAASTMSDRKLAKPGAQADFAATQAVGGENLSRDDQSATLKAKLAVTGPAAELIYVEASAEKIELFLKEWRSNPAVTFAAGLGDHADASDNTGKISPDADRASETIGTARRMKLSEVAENRPNSASAGAVVGNASKSKNELSKSNTDVAVNKEVPAGVIEKQRSGVLLRDTVPGSPSTVRLLLVIRLPKVMPTAIPPDAKPSSPR